MRQFNTLRRHCKDCGKEFEVFKNGRLCNKCIYKRHKSSWNKWRDKNRENKKKRDADWSKKNPDKNREKARRYLWKKKLKFLISQRGLGKQQVEKQQVIEKLKTIL